MDAELRARLDDLDAKLDYVVERHRYLEDLVREMTPVGREALSALADVLADWESRGRFRLASELVALVDRVADAYGPDDVHELSESVVTILDTVRNVTQPDVLELANDATNVLHDSDSVDPVGPLGMASLVRDEEVQRGLGIALAMLRQLGRKKAGGRGKSRAPRSPRRSAPSSPRPSSPRPSAPRAEAAPTPATPEVVEWEGRRFDGQGFLLDAGDWDEALAGKMADGLGIALTEAHWTVLHWARQDYLESGSSPNVRRMAAGSGVGVAGLYSLFPRTPGKVVAMIAGIPKPVGCV